MRRFYRLLLLLVALVGHTLYTSLRARRLPEELRPAYRARRQQIGCRRLCNILHVTVEREGEIPHAQGMLTVCNHIGVLDTLVLASQCRVAFVGKAEIGKWPLLGWVTQTMGIILVERTRAYGAARFVETLQERLQKGVNVLAFPEGTTSRGESVLPFKTGAFGSVAGRPGAFVLPLLLEPASVDGLPAVGERRLEVIWADAGQTFVEAAWRVLGLREVTMRLRVGRPIPAAPYDRKELARLAWNAVCELHAEGCSSAA